MQPEPRCRLRSNGTSVVAIKCNGKTWLSFDAQHWTPIAGTSPAPRTGSFLVLPRGIVVGGEYGAAP
jgi:hypothetical protein